MTLSYGELSEMAQYLKISVGDKMYAVLLIQNYSSFIAVSSRAKVILSMPAP